MRWRLTAAALLAIAALTIAAGGLLGLDPEPPPRNDSRGALPTPEVVDASAMVVALLVLAVVPVLQHIAVVVAWAWQPVAARRATAARIEAEAPLLEDYGHGPREIRIGDPLTPGDDMTWTQRTLMTAVIAAIVGGAALMGWTAWMASQHTEPSPRPAPAVVIPADM